VCLGGLGMGQGAVAAGVGGERRIQSLLGKS